MRNNSLLYKDLGLSKDLFSFIYFHIIKSSYDIVVVRSNQSLIRYVCIMQPQDPWLTASYFLDIVICE